MHVLGHALDCHVASSLTQLYLRKEQTARLSWLASLATFEKRSSDADHLHIGPIDNFQLQRHSLVRHAVGALNTASKNLTCGPGLLTWLLWTWALRPGTRMSGLHEVCEV